MKDKGGSELAYAKGLIDKLPAINPKTMAQLEGTLEEGLVPSLKTWAKKNNDDASEARTEGNLLKGRDIEDKGIQIPQDENDP